MNSSEPRTSRVTIVVPSATAPRPATRASGTSAPNERQADGFKKRRSECVRTYSLYSFALSASVMSTFFGGTFAFSPSISSIPLVSGRAIWPPSMTER